MAISRVNTTSGADFSGTASNTIAATAASHTSGNALVVGVRFDGGSTLDVALSDTAGNTKYRRIGRSSGRTSTTIELWIIENMTGHGSNVVTATISASRQFRSIVVAQYSGLATTTMLLDEMANIYGLHTQTFPGGGLVTLNGPAFDTHVADALLIGLGQVNATGKTWTAGSGFSIAVQDASNVLALEDQIVSSLQTGVVIDLTVNDGINAKDFLAGALATEITGGGGSPGSPGSPSSFGETGFAMVGG